MKWLLFTVCFITETPDICNKFLVPLLRMISSLNLADITDNVCV